jgi:hypothetical protein
VLVSKPSPIQGHKYLYKLALSSILLLPSIVYKQTKKKEKKGERKRRVKIMPKEYLGLQCVIVLNPLQLEILNE